MVSLLQCSAGRLERAGRAERLVDREREALRGLLHSGRKVAASARFLPVVRDQDPLSVTSACNSCAALRLGLVFCLDTPQRLAAAAVG